MNIARVISVVLLWVVSFSQGVTSSAFAGGPENQYSCLFGSVYNQILDKCRYFFEEIPPTSISQVLQNNSEREIKVLSLFMIKKGDTCIKVTGYTLEECFQLAYENGRTPTVFIAENGKHTYDVPLYVGEQMAFVRYTKNGNVHLGYILYRKK